VKSSREARGEERRVGRLEDIEIVKRYGGNRVVDGANVTANCEKL
jgi:hypothetical protein